MAVNRFLFALLIACCLSCEKPKESAKATIKVENVLPKLATLPYLSRTPVNRDEAKLLGVTRYDRAKSAFGITVICTVAKPEARLIGLDGKVLHTLRIAGNGCKVIEPYGKRYFVALARDGTVSMIDWESKLQWKLKMKNGAFHHDLAVANDGRIFVLGEQRTSVTHQGVRIPLLDNQIVILTPEGKMQRSISLFPIIADQVASGGPTARDALIRLSDIAESGNVPNPEGEFGQRVFDILHTNTIEILPRDTTIGKKGDILLCVRNADLVVVLDLNQEKVVWSWGPGELDWPHHPTILESGHLLVFDNGINRGYSRVVEYDPREKKVVWEYRSAQPKFFSPMRGSVQLLPNGNILVGESDRGRMFEVTRSSEIVWEYYTDIDRGENARSEGADSEKLERLLFYRTWRLYESSYPHAEYAALWQRYHNSIH